MRVWINEVEQEVPRGATAGALRDRFRPAADVLIRNGFPAAAGDALAEDDRLVLICRGEVPSAEEMEALLVARHTPGVYERTRRARVGIAGLGGLGSQVALALARTGVGTLVLVDFDLVEPSNLNRQQYFVDQLCQPKAQALTATLGRCHPYVRLEPHVARITAENAAEFFRGCQVVVEAFDRAPEKAMLVEAVLRDLPGTWVVAASGLAGHGPADTIRTHRVGPRLFVVGDLEAEARPGQGLMAPRVGVAAHFQANLVLRILLGEEGE